MTLEKPTIVLFDMDGTTVRHVNPRLLNILEYLDDLSYKIAKTLSLISRKGPKTHNIFAKPRKISPQVFMHKVMHTLRKKPVEKIVQPCPGIYTLLQLLQQHDIPMGIASNGLGQGYGHEILEKFNMDSYFTAKTFREDIRHSKPHPQSLLTTLDQLNLSPNDTHVIWYIGDRRKDISAAIAAQDHISGTIIPLAYGINAATAILDNTIGPDNIIINYQEFTQRIKQQFF